MVVFPNAKINIGLNIVEKRTDGFHNIETLFFPVPWCDVLEIIIDEKVGSGKRNSGVLFKASGIVTYSPKEKNLCVRAYRLLEKDFPLKPVRIYLHKNIPVGAGLGGGSSDAAFAIKLLDELFSLKLTREQMIHYASELGSDCTFFIDNRPAFATGKGDRLSPGKLNIDELYLIIVKPDIHVSTATAYSKVKPVKPERCLADLVEQPLSMWKESLVNDFEEYIFNEHEELRAIKQKLYGCGAVYASMSGSGSAIYGIFEKKVNAKKLFPGYLVWSGKLGN